MSATLVEFEATTLIDRLEKLVPPASSEKIADVRDNRQSEELLVEQLSPLASLHHTSYYSRLRFGPAGCTATYIPLSVHCPERFKELQAQQAAQIPQQAWWQSRCSQVSENGSINNTQSPCGTPLLSRSSSCTDLGNELLEAIASPLSLDPVSSSPSSPALLTASYTWKTSDSHPINISMMIPPELLQLISDHLSRAQNDFPTTLDIPPSKHLYYLLDRSQGNIDPAGAPIAHVRSITLASSNRDGPPRSSDIVSVFWKHTFARRRSKIDLPSKAVSKSAERHSEPRLADGCLSPDIKTIRRRLPQSRCKRDNYGATKITSSQLPMIGNLFLSSCPGKKVRLDGPVNGRSAVHRDLAQDLMRIRDAGVRCIVCCLDDAELEYLGAPWSEYSRIADDVGLDILRLPTPEGLAPLDPSTLDVHLTRLITNYTIKGHHTLVHCRGGVGRAGLIACCWMIKLGLCGWIHTDPSTNMNESPPRVKKDTLLLVERALSVVRRRRSPKAVETYEQVKFLVDYIEYLREKAAVAGNEDGAGIDVTVRTSVFGMPVSARCT